MPWNRLLTKYRIHFQSAFTIPALRLKNGCWNDLCVLNLSTNINITFKESAFFHFAPCKDFKHVVVASQSPAPFGWAQRRRQTVSDCVPNTLPSSILDSTNPTSLSEYSRKRETTDDSVPRSFTADKDFFDRSLSSINCKSPILAWMVRKVWTSLLTAVRLPLRLLNWWKNQHVNHPYEVWKK